MKKIFSCFLILSVLFTPFRVFGVEKDVDTGLISGAVSGVLMEANTGKIIYEKEKDKQVAIASMTKMVAQIIIFEEIEKGNIHYDDMVTVSKNAADMGGSQIYIEQGEKISVEDLIKGISMASGNDATVQMAEVISGSEEKFVKRMNEKVKELGLKNTVFKNCTGLDEEGHFSSAYDMAVIARELIVNHSDILKFSSLYEDYLREDTDNKFWLVNTNKLIRFYEGADGLKTGHTDAAGYCLAATAKRGDLRLIAIVLGEEDSKVRNSETMEFLDYGFSNVKMNLLKEKGEVVKKIKIDKADKEIVSIVLKSNLAVIEDPGEDGKYQYKIKMNSYQLPLKTGDVVGEIQVCKKNKVITSGELTVKDSVKALSYFDLFKKSMIDFVSGDI